MRTTALFILGTVAFVAITYFEQLPVLGWLGALVSVAGWILLGRALAREGGAVFVTSAVLGAWTGFIAAVTAWWFQTGNLFGLGTPPLDRVGASFGFLGATLGIFYWPLIGAAVCLVAAMVSPSRRWGTS